MLALTGTGIDLSSSIAQERPGERIRSLLGRVYVDDNHQGCEESAGRSEVREDQVGGSYCVV
jgi:hypothetical protein